MRISDWSSDVCSSDLLGHIAVDRLVVGDAGAGRVDDGDVARRISIHQPRQPKHGIGPEHQRIEVIIVHAAVDHVHADRKSVVEGKSVSVRVDLGGRLSIKKKKTTTELTNRLTK